eukprot:GFUD01088577.1.p1 GENE.GFUD01088577.1~~GFUD01088577.1.p1  ORF type:complete len:120 (+),score=13.50 GFUD01088577.1:49-408(+)
MLLVHLVCLAISFGIACSCKCTFYISNPGDDCLCDGSAGRRCKFGCGDCDVDEDCMEDLVCGTDNCNWGPYDKWDDCCMLRPDRTWRMDNRNGKWVPGYGEVRMKNRSYDVFPVCGDFS